MQKVYYITIYFLFFIKNCFFSYISHSFTQVLIQKNNLKLVKESTLSF